MLDTLVKPFISVAYFITKLKEKRLGYKIDFKDLPENWLQGQVIYEMDKAWRREGLDAIGTNYYTIGAIENGISSRFNTESPYFQSWLGGYVVKFLDNKNWGIKDHFRLTEADQKYWLGMYGDRKPKVEIDYQNFEELGKIEISGFEGNLFRGDIYSDTDIGNGNIKLYDRLQIIGLAVYFNKSNSKLKLISKNFFPKRTKDSLLESYQNVHLKGYIAILEIGEGIKVVLYGNAANFKDKNGIEHDNFKKIDKELLKLIKSAQIKKLQ